MAGTTCRQVVGCSCEEHVMTIDLTRREIMLLGDATPAGRWELDCGSRSGGRHEFTPVRGERTVRPLVRGHSGKGHHRLMALYASDIVYFDVVPPLHYTGSAAVQRNILRWFDA